MIEEFNWEQIAQKTIQVYARVVAESKNPAKPKDGLKTVSDEIKKFRKSFGVLYQRTESAAMDSLSERFRHSIRQFPRRMRRLIGRRKPAWSRG